MCGSTFYMSVEFWLASMKPFLYVRPYAGNNLWTAEWTCIQFDTENFTIYLSFGKNRMKIGALYMEPGKFLDLSL